MSEGRTGVEVIPSSFEELDERLKSLGELGSEEISFTLGALLFLASKSAKLLDRNSSQTEKFSLFMRFASCVDPKLDPVRTLKNYSGKFLNYAMDKIRSKLKGSVSCVAEKSLERLTDVLVRELSDRSERARKVVIGIMGVRDVSYIYVHFGWDDRLSSLYKSSKEGLGCPTQTQSGSTSPSSSTPAPTSGQLE